MPSHHVILGGGGFIGRHVALSLAKSGQRVTIASRSAAIDGLPADVRRGIALQHFDMRAGHWDDLVAEATVFHHYAWGSTPASASINPVGEIDDNIRPLVGLLDALKRRGSGRVVFASSGGSVYGAMSGASLNEDMALSPVSAYGAGKAAAEMFLGFYRAQHGIDVRIARIANVYGAGQNLALGVGAVSSFIDKALCFEPIVIWGDGRTSRDYIHVSDVARCLVRLAEVDETQGHYVFNVGTGQATSLTQLVAAIEGVLGRRLKVRLERGRRFDVSSNLLSSARAASVLNWSHRLSLPAGIVRTIEDLARHPAYSRVE